MAVPQEARLANMNPRLGSIHEMARLASPASVEKPTKGAMTRLAGMDGQFWFDEHLNRQGEQLRGYGHAHGLRDERRHDRREPCA